jgi:hypothetical protein
MADKSTPEITPKKKQGPGLMTLVKAVAIIAIIMAVEMVAASAILPSAEETEVISEKLVAAEAAKESAERSADNSKADQPVEPLAETHEVSLGAFHILTYQPVSGASINIDFDLYGTVLAEEESEFYQLFASNQRRIEEQVVIAMRGANSADLTDAGLGLIKRKILEKTNRALGKPLLQEAIFSKFLFQEQ